MKLALRDLELLVGPDSTRRWIGPRLYVQIQKTAIRTTRTTAITIVQPR